MLYSINVKIKLQIPIEKSIEYAIKLEYPKNKAAKIRMIAKDKL